MPIAAVVGRASVMDAARPGTVGGTYGGNPVSCAAALATIDVIEREGLLDRANEIGETIRGRFTELQRRFSVVADVRGVGAMQAMELAGDGDWRRPATALCARVREACLVRGVLTIAAGAQANVLRILAPLVISDADLERGLDVIADELASAIEPQTVATA